MRIHFTLATARLSLTASILLSPCCAIGQEADSAPVKVSLKNLRLEEVISDPSPGFSQALESVSEKADRAVQAAPKRTLQLGNRDDARAEGYSLEGRGQESPAGKKEGRYCTDGMQRAGNPWLPGIFAAAGTDPRHSVGYVGGSTPFKGAHSGVLQGECRRPTEGTFGYDYTGLYFQRNTWLLWTHGRREQGGMGRYETDGPRILPEK
jgi:hypothetical protein